jgi:hypothetical protein
VNQMVILQAEAAVYTTNGYSTNGSYSKEKTTKLSMQTACISTLQNQSKHQIRKQMFGQLIKWSTYETT